MPLRIKIFISLCLVIPVLQAKVPEKIYSMADSIFSAMSYSQRLSQAVWIGADDAQSISSSSAFGTVYFGQPLIEPPAETLHRVAVQLDERMNPLPAQLADLPGLDALSAITDDALLAAYFNQLISLGRAHHIDYMVLPIGQNSSQQMLIKKMLTSAPEYFRSANQLEHDLLKKKRAIKELFTSGQFWVVKPKQTQQVQKKIDRFAEKIWADEMENYLFNELLYTLIEYDSLVRKNVPYLMQKELVKASTVAYQAEDVLPMSSDTICFLSNEPYSSMAHMLRKYAYVKVSYAEIAKSSAPIIIDRNAFIPPGILKNRQLIYLGDLEGFPSENVSAALIYFGSGAFHDYIIPQQLFGVEAVNGYYEWTENQHLFPITLERSESLAYGPLSMVGLEAAQLEAIDEVIKEAISGFGTPGGQLAIVADGSLVLEKSFGYLTYDSLVPVDHQTLYDLASVTKVAATLLAVMKLHEEGHIDLDERIDTYLPEYKNSNKGHVTIKALLSHQAGLKPYVPFWKRVLSADHLDAFYYESEEDQLADRRSYGLKPNPILKDSLKNWIRTSPLLNYDSIPYYSYSDLGFMILHQVVEAITQMPMDHYLQEEFYLKMGLDRMTFNPLAKGFELFEIAPTEYDYYYRDELVWGEVHDRNASVFGGVAGHAGLFSNAYELAVLMQTLLFDGRYKGVQYLSKATIDTFNRQYFPANRRALGWDKKDDELGNVSAYASDESFGHTGFTGTMVWVDPQFDLIFVFLSNRIHPNANNHQLIRRNIRTRIQDVVYEALLAKWMK